jgi:hypothetical protein
MKIENQCCTKDQAHKLKEFGVAQNSFFAYIDEGELLSRHSPNLNLMAIATDFVAAFTVAELGLMLPPGYYSMRTTDEGWRCYDLDGKEVIEDYVYDYEAKCRAAAVIQLLESSLTAAEEINNRLKQ